MRGILLEAWAAAARARPVSLTGRREHWPALIHGEHPNELQRRARAFLNAVAKAAPLRIHTLLTDNGTEFMDRPFDGRAWARAGSVIDRFMGRDYPFGILGFANPSCAGCGRVALAVNVDVSFHPRSARAIGTLAEGLQPETIGKLIEQLGRPGHRRIGRRSVHVQAQLIGYGERYES